MVKIVKGVNKDDFRVLKRTLPRRLGFLMKPVERIFS